MSQDTIFDGNKYMGDLFMAVAAVNFNGMTELTMTVKRLPKFYKQRELLRLPGLLGIDWELRSLGQAS